MAATELTFTKVNNHYEATAKITEATPVHIERSEQGYFAINQKSYEDEDFEYATVRDSVTRDRVIDTDLVANVYPKYVQFYSDTEVLKSRIGIG